MAAANSEAQPEIVERQGVLDKLWTPIRAAEAEERRNAPLREIAQIDGALAADLASLVSPSNMQKWADVSERMRKLRQLQCWNVGSEVQPASVPFHSPV